MIHWQFHVPGQNIWSKRDNLFYCQNYCHVAALTDTGLPESLPVPRRPNPALPIRFCVPETMFSILIISNDLRRKNKNGKFTTKTPLAIVMIILIKWYRWVNIILPFLSCSQSNRTRAWERYIFLNNPEKRSLLNGCAL